MAQQAARRTGILLAVLLLVSPCRSFGAAARPRAFLFAPVSDSSSPQSGGSLQHHSARHNTGGSPHTTACLSSSIPPSPCSSLFDGRWYPRHLEDSSHRTFLSTSSFLSVLNSNSPHASGGSVCLQQQQQTLSAMTMVSVRRYRGELFFRLSPSPRPLVCGERS